MCSEWEKRLHHMFYSVQLDSYLILFLALPFSSMCLFCLLSHSHFQYSLVPVQCAVVSCEMDNPSIFIADRKNTISNQIIEANNHLHLFILFEWIAFPSGRSIVWNFSESKNAFRYSLYCVNWTKCFAISVNTINRIHATHTQGKKTLITTSIQNVFKCV